MAYTQNNVIYYDLQSDPKSPEEAIEALKKIRYAPHEAYKPDVASAALKYFDVITRSVAYCNFREYLTGGIYGKMAELTGNLSKDYVNSQGYINAFSVAIGLMIRNSEMYFEHKDKMDKNVPLLEILGIE